MWFLVPQSFWSPIITRLMPGSGNGEKAEGAALPPQEFVVGMSLWINTPIPEVPLSSTHSSSDKSPVSFGALFSSLTAQVITCRGCTTT